MKWLDAAMAPAVIIVVVFISPFVYWTFDRPKEILENYTLQLRYEQMEGRQSLHYRSSFITTRLCKFSAVDEIHGPVFIIMKPTPQLNSILGSTVNLELSRPISEPLSPGTYSVIIYFSFWCNPVQRWANWPIVQTEYETFVVPERGRM